MDIWTLFFFLDQWHEWHELQKISLDFQSVRYDLRRGVRSFCNFELFRGNFFDHKAYLQSKLNVKNFTLEKLQNLIRPYKAPY